MTNKPKLGQVFGCWTIIESVPKKNRRAVWKCACLCGVVKVVLDQNLRSGISKSCGHIASELRTTHGERKNRTPEYVAWTAMKQRCLNPMAPSYHRWGGRGVLICDRWRNSFAEFLKDVGRRPSGRHSLGRIDNDGNYEPENVRWETPAQQANNVCTNRVLKFNGESLTVSQWAKRLKTQDGVILARLKNMPSKKALSLPFKKHRRHLYNGKLLTIKELAGEAGINLWTVYKRIYKMRVSPIEAIEIKYKNRRGVKRAPSPI